MKKGNNGSNHQSESDERFGGIHDAYVLDASSGIYKLRPTEEEQPVQKKEVPSIYFQPLIVVEPAPKGTDWPSVIVAFIGVLVSAGALLLLYLTVAYTKRQWVQAQRTADASIAAAHEAQQSNLDSRNRFIQDTRPWVGISYPETTPMKSGQQTINGQVGVDLSIPSIVNAGRTPAQGVVVYVGLVRTRDIPYEVFIGDDKWMRRVVDRTIAGKFPSGIYTIQNLSPSIKSTQAINDPSYFPKAAVGNGAIELPKRKDIGVLLPSVPEKIPLAYIYEGPEGYRLGALIIYGKVTYRDVRNKDYNTTFCSWTLLPGKTSFSACPVFNNAP